MTLYTLIKGQASACLHNNQRPKRIIFYFAVKFWQTQLRIPHSRTCYQGSQETTTTGVRGKKKKGKPFQQMKRMNETIQNTYSSNHIDPRRSLMPCFCSRVDPRGMQLYPNRQGMLQVQWYMTVEHSTASSILLATQQLFAWYRHSNCMVGGILPATRKWYSIQMEIAWSVRTPHSLVQSTKYEIVISTKF